MQINGRTLKAIKTYGLVLAIGILVLWLAMEMATELLKHQQLTLDFLTGIESIKPWFFLLRLTLYTTTYLSWRLILTKLQPTISETKIIDGRRVLIRLFIAYELFFGINILSWITR